MPGEYGLMSKATDTRGRAQSMERNKDRDSYMINHVRLIKVRVMKSSTHAAGTYGGLQPPAPGAERRGLACDFF